MFSSFESRSRADGKRAKLLLVVVAKKLKKQISLALPQLKSGGLLVLAYPRKTTRKASDPYLPIKNSTSTKKVITWAVTKQQQYAKPPAQRIHGHGDRFLIRKAVTKSTQTL